MRVRQLERVLVEMGVPTSFLDVITRKLREARALPVGGRGRNAPEIGASEVAFILVAMGGAENATDGWNALHKQLALEMPAKSTPRHSSTFVDAVQVLVGNPDWAAEVAELRFGRTHALSQIIYLDGTIERFVGPEAEGLASGGSMRFRTEGIIGGGMLHQIAIDLAEPRNLIGLDG